MWKPWLAFRYDWLATNDASIESNGGTNVSVQRQGDGPLFASTHRLDIANTHDTPCQYSLVQPWGYSLLFVPIDGLFAWKVHCRSYFIILFTLLLGSRQQGYISKIMNAYWSHESHFLIRCPSVNFKWS